MKSVPTQYPIQSIAIERDACSYTQQSQINGMLDPFLDARSRHLKQPIEDFLFSYYSFAPTKLKQWNPGFGKTMPITWKPTDHRYKLRNQGNSWSLNASDFPEKRLRMLRWTINLQESILNRPPAFGCHGLHEWAMVYGIEEVRHNQLGLRLPPKEISAIVESLPIRCSHYDAFRFFTPTAVPLNKLHPSLDERVNNEQSGCIHVNMDLYKWSYKFHPWLGSEIIWESFMLAREIRYFDMQASPYDLSIYGLEPVRIETQEGRTQYSEKQQSFAHRANQLRKKLISELKRLEEWATSNS
jgi:hypothetical protein